MDRANCFSGLACSRQPVLVVIGCSLGPNSIVTTLPHTLGPEQPPTRSTYFKKGTEEQLLMMQKKKFILSDPDVCVRDEKIIAEVGGRFPPPFPPAL